MDKGKLRFKLIYYLVTLCCLGVVVLALRRAYLFLNIPMALWILLYVAMAAYLVAALLFVDKLKRGTHRFLAHSLTMQILPICAAIALFGYAHDEKQITEEVYKPVTGKPSTYERYFNDMQDKHKASALKNGLEPFASRAEIEAQYKKLHRSRKLVHIATNPKYIVRDLTHSSPYVVPKVEELLDDIAEAFQKKTQSKCRFVVTSELRTEEDIKKLKRVNGNASSASCHCNATTIDISYVRFGEDPVKQRSDYELRMALAQTLHELRKAGRCHVKIERKQYCYHITVI